MCSDFSVWLSEVSLSEQYSCYANHDFYTSRLW